ncbi:MAG TPA: PilT/PilU family type 4a pilus ATPase [Acidimicrobiia bacterium]|jgi:twitching motility protein PilT
MLKSQARQFGESLVERHVLSPDVLEDAIDESARANLPLPTILLQRGLVGPKDLAAALCFALGMDFVDFDEIAVQPAAAHAVPEALARKFSAIGVETYDDVVVIAFADPADHTALGEVSAAVKAESGLTVRPAGAERQQLLAAIESAYGPENAEVDAHLVGSGIDPELHRMFQRVQEIDASDLHLAAGQPPLVRILGDLHRLTDFEALTASRIRELVYSIISKRQQEQFETTHELDTNYTVPGIARYRVNIYLKRNGVAASFRQIPYTVLPFEELGLPEAVRLFSELPRGLVLVTGPTGSGKSTTLASIIDLVNQHRACHIITIEEPIEFVHESKMALVSQRDVGTDTASFATALRQALRQDPDVILVGEMRDLETISTAVTAAETGHLVFATLHTQDAAQTIDRIVDAFPAEQQGQVRIQVASTLQGIVTQQLIPTSDGTARAVAAEVLIATPAIRNLIRDGKIHQVFPMLQAGRKFGMNTMDEHLGALVREGQITMDAAALRCRDINELKRAAGVAISA